MTRRRAQDVKRTDLQHRPEPADPTAAHAQRQAEIRQRILETQGPGRDEAHLQEEASDQT